MSVATLIKSYVAGADLAAWRFVKFSAADTVTLGAAATDVIIGITTDVAAASGERQDVNLTGFTLIEAGAAFSRGAKLTADSVGRGVTAAPATGVNNNVGAMALEAATAAGDIVRAVLTPGVSLQG
jgi:hypothetical protein